MKNGLFLGGRGGDGLELEVSSAAESPVFPVSSIFLRRALLPWQFFFLRPSVVRRDRAARFFTLPSWVWHSGRDPAYLPAEIFQPLLLTSLSPRPEEKAALASILAKREGEKMRMFRQFSH